MSKPTLKALLRTARFEGWSAERTEAEIEAAFTVKAKPGRPAKAKQSAATG